jgi:putative peptide maturation dehydrogenase
MPRVRRTPYVFFHCLDELTPDISLLLRGVATSTSRPQLHAISILTGEEYAITREQLEFVCSLPSDRWVDTADFDTEVVRDLALKGMLVSDENDGILTRLRRRDEALATNGWNIYGALYHFMTRWAGVEFGNGDELGAMTPDQLTALLEERGGPPAPFHEIERPLAVRELPLARLERPLQRVLAERKTSRGFDPHARLSTEQFSVLLDQVWGCHGVVAIRDDIVFLKKTSPSGGGLHPVEVYPLVAAVDGIDPGLYHYRARDHALELIREMASGEAQAMATQFMTGQSFLGEAQVSFLMTARFSRSHWKYWKHQKAYAATLMDTAHLSQALYLVATELGLGAFVTAAINAADIDDALGLDGVEEGALAAAGCGVPLPGSPLEPEVTPYVRHR